MRLVTNTPTSTPTVGTSTYISLKNGVTLQSRARTGKAKFWYAFVARLSDGSVVLIKEWWLEGGAHQQSVPKVIKPKNVGKSNETSPQEQAEAELDSLYTKQRDKGYSEDGTKTHIPTKPMLAHPFKKRKSNVLYPCLTQPKFDGVRMLSNGSNAWSRGAKDYIPEVVQHLMFDTQGVTLDGELMLQGNMELQLTSRAYKSINPSNALLHYFVYDMVSDAPFWERHKTLKELFVAGVIPNNVHLVHCRQADNVEAIMHHHGLNLTDGYEGTIIRNAMGKYEPGHRSPNLLKLKEFQDSEFKVIDIEEGEGSFTGKAILVCSIEGSTHTFKAVPKGTAEYRAHVFECAEHYIGRWVTVRYQYLSTDGIPVGNTVGIAFRDKDEF